MSFLGNRDRIILRIPSTLAANYVTRARPGICVDFFTSCTETKFVWICLTVDTQLFFSWVTPSSKQDLQMKAIGGLELGQWVYKISYLFYVITSYCF